MPTYEYVCESCGHEFEAFQSMKDPKLTDCPQGDCEGSVRRRLGTGAGLIFKGSGFYETDYRSASYKEGAKKEQGSASPSTSGEGSSGGSSPSSESKPAAPSPAPAKAAAST